MQKLIVSVALVLASIMSTEAFAPVIVPGLRAHGACVARPVQVSRTAYGVLDETMETQAQIHSSQRYVGRQTDKNRQIGRQADRCRQADRQTHTYIHTHTCTSKDTMAQRGG